MCECAKKVFSIKLTFTETLATGLKKKAFGCPFVYGRFMAKFSFALRIIHCWLSSRSLLSTNGSRLLPEPLSPSRITLVFWLSPGKVAYLQSHPPPKSRMGKWRVFALRAPSSLIWGRWGFAVPFYFVQDWSMSKCRGSRLAGRGRGCGCG